MRNYLLALTLIIAIFSIAHTQTQTHAQQWEYKFEFKVNEKRANDLAAQGWELVDIGTENAGNMSVSFMAFRRAK